MPQDSEVPIGDHCLLALCQLACISTKDQSVTFTPSVTPNWDTRILTAVAEPTSIASLRQI